MTTAMATFTPTAAGRRQRRAVDDLLERERELAAVRQRVRNAAGGAGGVVFLEAPAGGGKSRLLEASGEIALEQRMRVRTVRGIELEREFPFALATRLLEPPSPAPVGREGPHHQLIHDLFEAIKELAGPRAAEQELQGLALLIDDAHWADPASLRLLVYLAERIAHLPIAVVVAATTGEPSPDPRALAALRRAAGDGLLPLAPLSADGVARAVRRQFPRTHDDVCSSCAQASRGNPFLLAELLLSMSADEHAPDAARADNIRAIVPEAVRDWVTARLESMPPPARAVAEAVAVLDEGASVARISRLARLDPEVVLGAADELAIVGLLAAGSPPALAQPMLGPAIRATLSPFERAKAHLRAARILSEQDAGAELIATHLLEAPADEDPAAVASLREAAETALRRGEPERATVLLNRALAERPKEELRAAIEVEANAASAAGLLIADKLERALEICDVMLPSGRDEIGGPARELIDGVRARALYEQGRLADAEAAAKSARDRSPADGGGYSQAALTVLARCHVERGELMKAESVLAAIERRGSRDSLLRASALEVRAQLRLAQHRPQEALRDAMHAGALLSEQLPDASPGLVAWRSSAALAHLALGEPRHARPLVERELERARRLGVTRIVIRDLRVLGLALGRQRHGLERLAESVAIGGSHPKRLEYVRALIDSGAALRRSGRRADAREPLRLALDLSHRAGASVLESRARAELIAAGARPRRAVLSGVDSLTSSQRRVAELAASGLTTRQIAGALFVTPKTVEFHLRHIYSKLEVSSREELTGRLSQSSAIAA